MEPEGPGGHPPKPRAPREPTTLKSGCLNICLHCKGLLGSLSPFRPGAGIVCGRRGCKELSCPLRAEADGLENARLGAAGLLRFGICSGS